MGQDGDGNGKGIGIGRIALVGGDEFRAGCADMDAALLRETGAPRPRVAIIPTAAAMERPDLAAQNGARHFAALGADAAPLMALNAHDANSADIAAPIDGADLIYLTGGNPARLLDALRGSLLLAKLRAALKRGAIVVGSSAGAMVLGERMRFRGEWHDALGMVPGVVVLPHHERADPDAVLSDIADDLAAGTTALGIDGATGCVADGAGGWRVLGAGAVAVYAAGRWRRYVAGERFALAAKSQPN